MAFEKGMTIKELFVTTILKSYQAFQQDGLIPLDKEKEKYYLELIVALRKNQFGQLKKVIKDFIKLNGCDESESKKESNKSDIDESL